MATGDFYIHSFNSGAIFAESVSFHAFQFESRVVIRYGSLLFGLFIN
jgi:hypothetical protein